MIKICQSNHILLSFYFGINAGDCSIDNLFALKLMSGNHMGILT